MSDIRVNFLGSGDAFYASGRHQAGYLVDTGETAFLLDCGTTTLASLKRDHIDPGTINAVFLSHLHADHFAGLPFLFLEYMFEAPRRHPLTVAGPPGTEERVKALFGAMYRDLSKKPVPFRLEFAELLPDRPFEWDGIKINPFAVPHQEHEISMGLEAFIGRKRILYSGDTGWTEDLLKHSGGTDLFICECCFFETRMPYHLDYPRLWENRQRFATSRLVLTHLGKEVLARQPEIELELARDGMTVQI